MSTGQPPLNFSDIKIKWELQVDDTKKDEIHLIPNGRKVNAYSFSVADVTERQELCKRLKRIIDDERTHGIEIYNRQVSMTEIPVESKLELNVWDFAGQHEYYNNQSSLLVSPQHFPCGVEGDRTR